MYSPDLLPVFLITAFILFYNPIMTTVFINQRFDLNNIGFKLSKKITLTIIFILTFCCQYLFRFLGHDPSIWLIMYFLTITVLVVWDRIAKRNEKNIKKHSS
jgi:hypothetical protein